MAASINDRFELWKNKLLDLGKRNRLINYKETKSSTLRITHPEIEDLFDRLVRKEDSLAFPRAINLEEDLEDPEQVSLLDDSDGDAFFVKSLENVQGDERDTIIFSIGYAPDASGVFKPICK